MVLTPGDDFKVPQEQKDDRGLALRSVLKSTVGQVRARDKHCDIDHSKVSRHLAGCRQVDGDSTNTVTLSGSVREDIKYYFADFVRKGVIPPPFTDNIFA